MASSKAVSSSASRNSDLRQKRSCSLFSASTKSSSISDLHSHNNRVHLIKNNSSNNSLCSMAMVDNLLLRNKEYGEDQTAAAESTLLDAEITLLDAAGAVMAISDTETNGGVVPMGGQERISVMTTEKKKTVDDVWKEIVAGRRKCKEEAPDEMMTLEDFLAKAEAVEEEEEDVKVRLSGGSIRGFDSMAMMSPFPPRQISGGVVVVGGFGDGEEVIGGRGKRRAILEPLDKAAQQRQRRMIKNRESAARSRERKQAYQVELESLAVKLEEENEKLLKEKGERTRERFKRLMEKVVPVVDNRRPPRLLRRAHSMEW
ncbi:G-box-binding factor 4 [Rhododendron vialii]|uniref:G-box-binding factor 4 n=1 Tax=Rhododendron vialii TaxID=182163 RepID=UPI00265F6C47|nr:G-box-binding factor 4 [Rhododendron vialii]XP_058215522.1 G-box-binding factor 4 [Rhododendron vialii]